jgi:phospholipase/carboxylesterase
LLAALVVLLLWQPWHRGPDDERVTSGGELTYIEWLSQGADPAQPLPTIIAMHGLGARPESFVRLFEGFPVPARFLLPAAPTPYGNGFSWYPLQGPAKIQGVRTSAALVKQLLEFLPLRFATKGLPIVTGFSQGGTMSFALALQHGEQIAAAVPVAGSLLVTAMGDGGDSRPPVFALHGAADRVVPLEEGKATVAALRRKGFAAELEEFPGVAHSIPRPLRDRLFARLQDLLANP